MRKLFIGVLVLSLNLFLFGCSSDKNEDKVSDEQAKVSEIAESNKRVDEDNLEVGDELSNEHGQFTVKNMTTELVEVEQSSLNIKVSRMFAASGDVADKFVDILQKERLDYIELDLRVENITNDIINFPIVKATMVTNTGEEIEGGDILLSDFVQDEIRSQVYVHGTFIFILEETKAEDVEAIRLVWDAPTNEDGDALGEAVEVELSF